MLFKDVIGQENTKRHLIELVQHNRLSHALLFVGKEGSGALPLAMALAGFVCLPGSLMPARSDEGGVGDTLFNDVESAIPNDQEKPHSAPRSGEIGLEPDELTQKNPAYSKVKDIVHPDIHFSYPVITKKTGTPPISTDYIQEWREFISANPYGNVYDWLQFIGAENKQGNITAQECNDIIRKLNLKSFESEYKILIVWMPEYLGNEGNKLLKLIEEPPPNTLFILVTENESQILPTILSRTQLVRIPALETDEIAAALVERSKIPVDQARKIASVADGNFREALQLTQQSGEDWETLLRDWLNAILKTGPLAQVKWVEEISKLGRERQKQFLRYCNHLLEQAIKLRIMDTSTLDRPGFSMPDNERDFAGRLNQIADISQQKAIVEELDKASYYIERNAHAKMLFHALTIKLYHIIANRRLVHMT
jgi:DNA polymerase-3 subunit delta'